MGRPPVPEDVLTQIGMLWVEDPSQMGTEVYQHAVKLIDACPSERKVQEIVRAAKKRASDRSLPSEDPPLVPWGQEWPTAAGEIACLFKLLDTARQSGSHVITCLTAQWALKLRKVFASEWESSVIHLSFAYLYAVRDRWSQFSGAGLYTWDLDSCLMSRFWESEENHEAFMAALENDWSGILKLLRPIGRRRTGEVQRGRKYELVPGLAQSFSDLLDKTLRSSSPEGDRNLVKTAPD